MHLDFAVGRIAVFSINPTFLSLERQYSPSSLRALVTDVCVDHHSQATYLSSDKMCAWIITLKRQDMCVDHILREKEKRMIRKEKVR